MIRIVHKYLYVLIAVVFASACSDLPDTSEVQHPQYISFELSEGETKITNSDITAHEFAVWVYDTKLKTKIVDGNVCTLRYDADSGRWRFYNGTFFDVLWGEGGHDFFAVNSVDLAGTDATYYFDAESGMGYEKTYNVNNCRFGVPVMNMMHYSGESDYNYYKDFVFAYTSRDVATEGYSPVSLTFRHLWPSLEFNIINESGQTKLITDFSISNFKVAFDGFSFYANTFVNSNYLFELTTHTDVSNNKYTVQEEFELGPNEERSVFGVPVMVYPQKFEANQTAKLNLTVDGVEVSRTFHGDSQSGGLSTPSWEPGKLYSYNINLKPIPPKVGDFFYDDGTYSTDLNTSKTVVGVVFYVGDPTAYDDILKRDYPHCTHGLVVGFYNYSSFGGALSLSTDWGSPDGYMDTHGINGANTLNIKRLDPAAVMTGYNNTCVLRLAQPGANAISVCDRGPDVEGASTWYMPTIAECDVMITNFATVNDSLNEYYNHCLSNSYSDYNGKYFRLKDVCWTVSEDVSSSRYAATYDFSNGGALGSPNKTFTNNIRPIFAF